MHLRNAVEDFLFSSKLLPRLFKIWKRLKASVTPIFFLVLPGTNFTDCMKFGLESRDFPHCCRSVGRFMAPQKRSIDVLANFGTPFRVLSNFFDSVFFFAANDNVTHQCTSTWTPRGLRRDPGLGEGQTPADWCGVRPPSGIGPRSWPSSWVEYTKKNISIELDPAKFEAHVPSVIHQGQQGRFQQLHNNQWACYFDERYSTCEV